MKPLAFTPSFPPLHHLRSIHAPAFSFSLRSICTNALSPQSSHSPHSLHPSTVPPPHTPVLLFPILTHFSTLSRPISLFLDLTVGAGGHAAHLLSRLPITRYLAIDKDPTALALARTRLRHFNNITFIQGDFRRLPDLLAHHGFAKHPVDGCLLDAGASSMQLDSAHRGFSFMRDGPLDMRMDAGEGGGICAADVVNRASAATLERIFREFGEEREARRIAEAVMTEREQNGDILTTGRLAQVVVDVKGWRKKGVHPATLVFQALRVAVNGELEALRGGLPLALEQLGGGGRMAVISFHSLEDRVVKRCFKEWTEREEGVGWINKKPIVAGWEERRSNTRSRSAKLRIVQRLEKGEQPWGKKVNKYADQSGDIGS